MKKKMSLTRSILAAVFLSLLVNSCDGNEFAEAGMQEESVALGFTATIEKAPGSRAVESVDKFPAGDNEFNMFITKPSGSPLFEGSDRMKAVRSMPGDDWHFYRLPGNSEITPKGVIGKPIKVVAYYPYAESTTAAGVSFDFSGDNLKQKDLLYYSSDPGFIIPDIQGGGPNPVIPLKFKHAYCRIKINVKKSLSSGTIVNLSGVSIDNLTGSWIKNRGTISPESGLVVKEGSTAGAIRGSITETELTTDFVECADILVPAFMNEAVKNSDIIFILTIDGEQVLFHLQKDNLNAEGEKHGFQSGVINTYNLVYDNSDLGLNLQNWTSVEVNGNFGETVDPEGGVPINIKGMSDGAWKPRKKSTLLEGIDINLYESYLTSKELGNNGVYVAKSTFVTDPTLTDEIDDNNVVTMEAVAPIFMMTAHDLVVTPVPWDSKLGGLEAKEVCKRYRGGGFTNWRLPRASEFRAAIVWTFYADGNKNTLNFKDRNKITYWTATEGNSTTAWAITVLYATEETYIHRFQMRLTNKSRKAFVRCIRNVKSEK